MLLAKRFGFMSFELLAPHYTWMEAVLAGRLLQRCRITWLEELAGCDRVLIAGVGHGHFLRALARRFPKCEIVSVDASAGMLARACLGARGNSRLQFVQAALPEWRPDPESFDAVVTHFFLDCFAPDELDAVVEALAHAAKSRAKWLITDFAIPPRGWKRHRARAIHTAMYSFFRPVAGVKAREVTPPDTLLRAQGFALSGRKNREWGLIQADLWTRG
jgi:ubiquinone/menaquinone biosynthesis C-methylase UbiE